MRQSVGFGGGDIALASRGHSPDAEPLPGGLRPAAQSVLNSSPLSQRGMGATAVRKAAIRGGAPVLDGRWSVSTGEAKERVGDTAALVDRRGARCGRRVRFRVRRPG